MPKQDDLQEEVQRIFQDISRESQSLQDIDLRPLVKEWKEICQSLHIHIQEDSNVEYNNSSLDDNFSDNEAHIVNNPSLRNSGPQQNPVQEMQLHNHENDEIIEIEQIDDGEGSWTYDMEDAIKGSLQVEFSDIENDILDNLKISNEDYKANEYQDLPSSDYGNAKADPSEPTMENAVLFSELDSPYSPRIHNDENSVIELELIDDGEGSWTYDMDDNASYVPQVESAEIENTILHNLNNFIEDYNINDYDDLSSSEDENIERTTPGKALSVILETPEPVTWEVFEEQICNSDKWLLSKCKTNSNKVEESISFVESNIYILNKIQSLQKRLLQIYDDNFVLLGGPTALEHVEERTREINEIMSYHKEMKDVLVKIRRTFPGSETIVVHVPTVSIDVSNTSESPFIESRPVPHFWK